MAWAVWITGLPGSGKSAIAKELIQKLKQVQLLRLDELRKKIVPEPKYTEEERDYVYKTFVEEGVKKLKAGQNVIYDATAHRRKWRNLVRQKIDCFLEVYIKCPLDVCVQRESKRKEGLVMAELYKKALVRKKEGKEYPDLGEVIGVDVPYEESENAEIVIESDKKEVSEAAEIIFLELKKKGWV